MNCYSFDCGKLSAEVNISRFQGQDGVEEYHLVVQPTEYASFETQLEWVFAAYKNAMDSIGLDSGQRFCGGSFAATC